MLLYNTIIRRWDKNTPDLRARATYSPLAYSSSRRKVWWAEKVVRCLRGRLSLRLLRATEKNDCFFFLIQIH